MNPEKPGWQTTEFWLSLLPLLVQIAVVFGLLTSDQAIEWTSKLSDFIMALFGVIGIVAPILAVWKYTDSRTKVKQSALELRK